MVVIKRVGGMCQLVHRIWRTIRTGHLGPDYEIAVWAERPFIYLDHWALRRLSEDLTLGSRFLAAIEHRGTLMFSLMNVVEIARDCSPHRIGQIRGFLEKVGPHWVPMTMDPLTIIAAEETASASEGVDPCVSVAFLTDPAFASRLILGPVSLVHVVDLSRGPNGQTLRRDTDRDTSRLRGNIEE